MTPTDLAVSELLSANLPRLLKGSEMISEESHHNASYKKGPVWIIDPIDGTNNFIYELNFSVVSIALFIDGLPMLGVVYNPYSKDMYHAVRGKGAFLNGAPIRVGSFGRMEDTMVLLETGSYNDRASMTTFRPLRAVFRDCVDYRVTGCSAMDICYVASGKVGAFFSELISIWDYAAALLILEEAGGMATRWDCTPLDHGVPGNILATNGILHPVMAERISQSSQPPGEA